MVVEVEAAAPPAEEQAPRKHDDQHADEHLGALEDGFRKVRPVKNDRQSEDEERRRMSEPPGEAEAAGEPSGALLLRPDERGHGREMVGIGRMTQTEHDG